MQYTHGICSFTGERFENPNEKRAVWNLIKSHGNELKLELVAQAFCG
jgi:hypothetical protein